MDDFLENVMGLTACDGERPILRFPLSGRTGRPGPFIPAAKFTLGPALPYNSSEAATH